MFRVCVIEQHINNYKNKHNHIFSRHYNCTIIRRNNHFDIIIFYNFTRQWPSVMYFVCISLFSTLAFYDIISRIYIDVELSLPCVFMGVKMHALLICHYFHVYECKETTLIVT